MEKIGDFWIPDIDAKPGRNLARSKFGFEGKSGVQIENLSRALEFVPHREIAIDGGANVGAWTKLMAVHFEKTHSFEPNPLVFECLERNINDWGLTSKVVAYGNGISDQHELVSIKTRREDARTVTGRIAGRGNIECVTIDSIRLPACSFLKLDIEGYEGNALRGAASTIRRFRPWILIENKRTTLGEKLWGTSAQRILKRYGYKLIEKIGDNEIDWLYMPK